MKNSNTKTKLVARVMLLVLLFASVLLFVACNDEEIVDTTISFTSNDKFIEFIKKYNSQNDGFVYTFVDFDFDDNSQIETYQYNLSTTWKSGYGFDKMYDNNHSSDNGFICDMIFYMNEVPAQIVCQYKTLEYNFYQDDKISYEIVGTYSDFASDDGVLEEWADKRTFNMETLSYDKYYNYMYVYQINIEKGKIIDLKITSKNELSDKQLDEILQFFVSNIVIINTEG